MLISLGWSSSGTIKSRASRKASGIDVDGGDSQGGGRNAPERGVERAAVTAQAENPGVELGWVERFDRVEHERTVVPDEGGPGVVDRGDVALDHGLEPGIGGLTRPRRGTRSAARPGGDRRTAGPSPARAAVSEPT